MPDTHAGAPAPAHPAPQRNRVAPLLLGACIAIGPVCWSAQLLINYMLGAQICFGADHPVVGATPPGYDWLRPTMAALVLGAIVVAVASALLSWRHWTATRDEAPGPQHHFVEVGEGRTRFLAIWGLATSALFALVIIFVGIPLLVVPTCG